MSSLQSNRTTDASTQPLAFHSVWCFRPGHGHTVSSSSRKKEGFFCSEYLCESHFTQSCWCSWKIVKYALRKNVVNNEVTVTKEL